MPRTCGAGPESILTMVVMDSGLALRAPGMTSFFSREPPSPQIQFLEKIIALVVDDDEGREILDLDAPDCFHAEFGIFDDLDLLDAVLGGFGRRSADRA